MNTEQAYIEGFVKRASEYGFSEHEAIELLKQAGKKIGVPKKAPSIPGKYHNSPPLNYKPKLIRQATSAQQEKLKSLQKKNPRSAANYLYNLLEE